jgi:hypothetical protein
MSAPMTFTNSLACVGFDAKALAGAWLVFSGMNTLGEWLVRVLEANAAALTFWRCEISSHSIGSYSEMPHIVNGRRWTFFRFVSN